VANCNVCEILVLMAANMRKTVFWDVTPCNNNNNNNNNKAENTDEGPTNQKI
jgi:hypothetical protein